MSKIVDWFIARLKEKGTLSVLGGAVVSGLALVGLDLDPEQQLKVQGLIAAATGLLVSFFKEKTDVAEK